MVRCSASRGSLTSYPLEHNDVPNRGITFPKIAEVLISIFLKRCFLNPTWLANEHTHQHLLQDVCLKYDTESLSILGVGQKDGHEDLPQRFRWLPKKKYDFLVSCFHLWPMLVWDGIIEFLNDKVAVPGGDADRETAVGIRVMVFKVGDQTGAVAHASDLETAVPYASVGLVVECWDMLFAG